MILVIFLNKKFTKFSENQVYLQIFDLILKLKIKINQN